MPKILIVDDEPRITRVFGQAFEREAGYEITCANDGREALRLLQAGHFELIVLDWRLKGEVEGKDVLAFAKKESPQTPVFVVTASVQSVREIQSLGADQCLLKPCADLKNHIKKLFPS